MDTKKDCIAAEYGILSDKDHFAVVVGSKQIRKALNAGKTSHVFLAENADPAITEPLAVLCQQTSVPCTWVPDMSGLGHACGIDVGASAAAVADK